MGILTFFMFIRFTFYSFGVLPVCSLVLFFFIWETNKKYTFLIIFICTVQKINRRGMLILLNAVLNPKRKFYKYSTLNGIEYVKPGELYRGVHRWKSISNRKNE